MSSNYFFSLLILLTVLYACTGSENNADKSDLSNFQISEYTIDLKLPEGWGHFGHRVLSNSSNVYLFDPSRNSLAEYDRNTLQLSVVREVQTEGPEGIKGGIADLWVDEDGIFWIMSPADILYQLNRDLKIVKTWELSSEDLMEEGLSLMTFSFVKVGDKIYLPVMPLSFDWTVHSPSEISEMPNLVSFDLESNEIIKLSNYDSEFLGTNLNKLILPTIFKGKDQEVLINHNFKYIYVHDQGETRKYLAPLSVFKNHPPISNKSMFDDMEEIMRIVSFSDIYEGIQYFPENQIYIRIAKFEEAPDESQTDMRQFIQSKWGLVILNSDLELIGEILLPENQSNPNYMIENSKGVWYSTAHGNNPELDEEFLTFRLIERVEVD
jgi:hypothetical protein